MHTILSSATKTVRIGDDQPFAIIGERINPTGRKIFQLQLRNGDLSRVEIDVKEQVDGGAMLLDVNMGTPLADEAALMTEALELIQRLTDRSGPIAMRQALGVGIHECDPAESVRKEQSLTESREGHLDSVEGPDCLPAMVRQIGRRKCHNRK